MRRTAWYQVIARGISPSMPSLRFVQISSDSDPPAASVSIHVRSSPLTLIDVAFKLPPYGNGIRVRYFLPIIVYPGD